MITISHETRLCGGILICATLATSSAIAQGNPQLCDVNGVPHFQPDPPMFRAQGRILAYEDVADADQMAVRDFQYIPETVRNQLTGDFVLEAPENVFRFYDDVGTPTGKKPDQKIENDVIVDRTPVDRYLNIDHPKGQPNTDFAAWRRVRCVHQPDEEHRKLPLQWRTRDNLLDEPAAEFAEQTLLTIPQIEPPDAIRTTYVETGPSLFPGEVELVEGELIPTSSPGASPTPGAEPDDPPMDPVDRFGTVPGTNMLPTVARNLTDTTGVEMQNTLNSSKLDPYELHAEKPHAEFINPESPADDLHYLMTTLGEIVFDQPYLSLLTEADDLDFDRLIELTEGVDERLEGGRTLVEHKLAFALDIIVGNDGTDSNVPGDRAYRGFPLLNHSGHKRVNRVMPVFDANGSIIGGKTTVRQIWYGGRIQSDTMYFDFGWDRSTRPASEEYVNCGEKGQPTHTTCREAPPIPPDVPWTIDYEISVLSRGNDDFSPMTMQFDCPFRLAIDGMAVIDRSDDEAGEPPNEDCEDGEGLAADGEDHQINWAAGPLYASLDQSFFPMNDGTKVTLPIEMAPPQYYNLTYTWGWRKHPPRAQAIENAHKVVPPPLPFAPDLQMACHPVAAGIVEHERWAFEGIPGGEPDELPPGAFTPPDWMQTDGAPVGPACLTAFARMIGMTTQEIDDIFDADPVDPPPECDLSVNPDTLHCLQQRARVTRRGLLERFYGQAGDVENPIDRISDLAPAKRLWRSVRAMQEEMVDLKNNPPVNENARIASGQRWVGHLLNARTAYLDWQHRTKLPGGIAPDPASDLTLLYVNNTIYGEITGGGYLELPNWRRRGDLLKVTLFNGDYFPHGYLNVDFGGARGWENTFKSSVQTAGSGAWFTFGRFHARFNTVPGTIVVDAATRPDDAREEEIAGGAPETITPGVHRVMMKMNFEPSPRLKIYQFDPLHHDAAIYSLH